ncbi:snRNA-activating protein complex subunit 1-like [Megalops cyprinoides]|uniref:snRNA-activating protein complex subunit 1-like n=1 Tax=Megalops cyprinoides TaxID=118141 RepID=UPI001863ADA9|nr:snRNA-activating protein complex subunit 1-like [Megalops cyprinoides]
MDYYIGALKADFEELLRRFQQTETVRYEEFSAIWREMNFSSIFYGAMSSNEIRLFSRLTLIVAYQYFLPPYSFQIRVGGLYLLYSLYHTQLASPREQIRLALKDWSTIEQFRQDVQNAEHYDAAYIFSKLFKGKAFFFSAMPKQLSFQVKRKPQRHVVCEEFRDDPVRVRELVSEETLQEMENLQEHYSKVKKALCASAEGGNPGLLLSQNDLVQQLRNCALDYQHWQEKKEGEKKHSSGTGAVEEDPTKAESSRRAQLLESIKSKSYGHVMEASKSRRHRQVERDNSGSGTDPGEETMHRRRKPPSLRARTRKNLCSKPVVKQEELESTRPWHLSVMEGEKGLLAPFWSVVSDTTVDQDGLSLSSHEIHGWGRVAMVTAALRSTPTVA